MIARGSPFGSALLIIHRWQGQVRAFERMPDLGKGPVWRPAANGEDAVGAFVARQQRFDPELWIVELDVAELQRFVPDISTTV